MTMTLTPHTDTDAAALDALYELRSEVESANDSWFDALDAGRTGKEESAEYKRITAEYRSNESALLAANTKVACGRCGGNRVVNYGRVVFDKHVSHAGVVSDRWCFECGGVGKVPLRKHRFGKQAPALKRGIDAARAKQVAEQTQKDTNFAAFAASHPEIGELLSSSRGDDAYERVSQIEDGYEARTAAMLVDFAHGVERFGSLTEKQLAVVEREIARHAEAVAATQFPTGQVVVEAKVMSLSSRPSYAGGTETRGIYQLLGEHSGNRAMGAVPEKLWRAIEGHWLNAAGERTDSPSEGVEYVNTQTVIGSTIRFTATFTRADDLHFGFFKSPKKVEIIETGSKR